jgi:glycosyltransferase involved in cell wall biosynthesis
MRVLVLSHAAVLAANQALYARLVQAHGIDLTLVAPARWTSDLRGPLQLEVVPALAGRVVGAPVLFAGQRALHCYARGLPDVRRRPPQVVYVDEEPWSLAALQALLLARRARACLVVATKQNVPRRLPPPFAQVRRLVLRHAAAVIALTAEVAAVVRAQGYGGPLAIIPHGVALDQFAPAPAARARLRAAWGVPPEAYLAGYAGRFLPVKGLSFLIAAAAHLCVTAAGPPPCHLVLVGEGPERPRLAAQIHAAGLAGTVHLVPSVPHDRMAGVYSALDVLVLPSVSLPGQREQFGRVLIEALACDTPVIGTASGGIPEVIHTTGGGLVVPEADPAALARALGHLRDPAVRHAYAARGRAGVQQHYSLARVAARTAAVLAALGRGGG